MSRDTISCCHWSTLKTLSHSACDIFIRAFQSDAILFLCLSNVEGLRYFGLAILPVICAAFAGLDCNLFDFSRQNMTSVAALAGIPASTGTKVVYLAHWTACVVFNSLGRTGKTATRFCDFC